MIKKSFEDIYNELIAVCIKNNIEYESYEDDIQKVTKHYHTYQNLFVDALENKFCFDYKEIDQPITGNKINKLFTPSNSLLSFSFMSLSSFDAFNNITIPEDELILYITALANYNKEKKVYQFSEVVKSQVAINDNKRQKYQTPIMAAFSAHILEDLKAVVIHNSNKMKKLCESIGIIDDLINTVYRSGYDLNALFVKDTMYTPESIVSILNDHSEIIFITTDINIERQLDRLKEHYKLDNKNILADIIDVAESFINKKSEYKEKKQTILSKFFNKFK